MADAYVYSPLVPSLTKNGAAITNVTEVFFAIRNRPAQTVESGVTVSADSECQLDWRDYTAADLTAIIAQGGAATSPSNPLATLGVSPQATGVHRPTRVHRAYPGDTVQIVFGAGNATYTVGLTQGNVADALGQKPILDTDTGIALIPAP